MTLRDHKPTNKIGNRLKTCRYLSSTAMTRALGFTAALTFLMGANAAHAQDATPFSFGDMLVPGGVTLPGGITAQATAISTGTGVPGSNHGQTGNSPASIGGQFTDASTGFDEANRPIGLAAVATRIHVNEANTVDQGEDLQYQDTVGFKVEFSAPLPVSYFYGLVFCVQMFFVHHDHSHFDYSGCFDYFGCFDCFEVFELF